MRARARTCEYMLADALKVNTVKCCSLVVSSPVPVSLTDEVRTLKEVHLKKKKKMTGTFETFPVVWTLAANNAQHIVSFCTTALVL